MNSNTGTQKYRIVEYFRDFFQHFGGDPCNLFYEAVAPVNSCAAALKFYEIRGSHEIELKLKNGKLTLFNHFLTFICQID